MSNMRTLLVTLVQIIFDYHNKPLPSVQEQHGQIEDEDFFFVQPIEITATILDEMETLVSQTKEQRLPIFIYLLHIVRELYDFMESTMQIDDVFENNDLQSRLVDFIMSVYILLQTSQSSIVLVSYNDEHVPMYGFKANFIKPYCRTGDCFHRALAPLFFSSSELITKASIESVINSLDLFQYEIVKKENEALKLTILNLTEQRKELKTKLERIKEELFVDEKDAAAEEKLVAVSTEHSCLYYFSKTIITRQLKTDTDSIRPIDILMTQQKDLYIKIDQLSQDIARFLTELEAMHTDYELAKSLSSEVIEPSLSQQETTPSYFAKTLYSFWSSITNNDEELQKDAFYSLDY